LYCGKRYINEMCYYYYQLTRAQTPEWMRLGLSRPPCRCPAAKSAPHCVLMQVWSQINNSERWHSWVESPLFMAGIGTDTWLLLILSSGRHRNHFHVRLSPPSRTPLCSTPLYSSIATPFLSLSLSLSLSLYHLPVLPLPMSVVVLPPSLSRSP